MADKIFRRRIKYYAGGQNIAEAGKIIPASGGGHPKNTILPKFSQCRKCLTVPKTLFAILKHCWSYPLSLYIDETFLYISKTIGFLSKIVILPEKFRTVPKTLYPILIHC